MTTLEADDLASQSLPVDWSVIVEAVERRAWLLVESDISRVSFDDLSHSATCNVNPLYHTGRAEVWKRGCDCGAVKAWKDKQPRQDRRPWL